MKKLIDLTITATAVCMITIAVAAAGNIPFPQALEEANVSLSSMSNAQHQSLMLGNGDLYGIIWEKDGGLFMRITKNDIWDARVDTSKDGELPKVDIVTGKITGSKGAPPSYSKLYPQPRCAAALRIGPSAPAESVSWTCIRRATQNALKPGKDGYDASMEVAGGAEQSTGYQAKLNDTPIASSFSMSLKGSGNARYYVDIFGKDGKAIHASGWKQSPPVEKEIIIDLQPEPIDKIILYTMTTNGQTAVNQISNIRLLSDNKERPLKFEEPLQAHLDITKALVSIKQSGREPTVVRILKDRNVVLIDSPLPVTLEEIKADTLPDAKLGKTDGVSWLLMKMPGDVDYKGMDYALALARKGRLKAVSLVTSFDIQSADVLEHAIALAKKTINQQQTRLIANHERAWEEYFSRSGIELADKELQRWWYRMLYFAATVSKPGTAPVALMPPLATDATPWHADYHHNYNTWQMFWPLPAANQPELADPWISYVNDMIPRFKYLAEVTYDCEGVFFPISSFLHEPDPADCKSKNKRQMSMNPWGLTIGLVGMTAQSMWQKHLCDPDPEYLKAKIYPAVREGARFYASYMEKCKKDDQGKILLGPSYSPEHGPMGIYNCPFDIAYVHYTFDALAQAANELKVDSQLVARCRKLKELLPDYPTATDGNGNSVVVDWTGCKYKEVGVHNITVPASPVFPGEQVTWFSPEPVKELFRRTIKDTRFNGNNSHVIFNIAKARLSMPEAVDDAKNWFTSRELPNGLFVWQGHAHGTFMPEMVGIAGLINEYMMQSVQNKIRVFPCWPNDKDARFTRLRAQGGFLVSAEQKNGEVVSLVIDSTVGGKLRLLSPWPTIKMKRRSRVEALTPDSSGIVQIDTRAKGTIAFFVK